MKPSETPSTANRWRRSSLALRVLPIAAICAQLAGCGGEGLLKPVKPSASLNCKAQVNWAFPLPSGKIGVYTIDERVLIWDPTHPDAPVSENPAQKGIWAWHVRFPSESLAAWGLWEIANNEKNAVVVYDLQKKQEKYHFDLKKGQDIGCIAAGLTGKFLVWTEAAKYDRKECTAKVADLATGNITAETSIPVGVESQMMDHLAISPDDTIIATGSNSGEGAVAAVDRASGKLLWKTARDGGMGGIAFHPDSKSFFVSGMGAVIRYDSATGKELSSWSLDENLGGVAVAANGSLVAVGASWPNAVVVWQVADGRNVAALQLQKFSNTVCPFFSSDGKGIWVGDALNRGCLELLPLPQH